MNNQSHFFYAIRIPETTKMNMKEQMDQLKELFPFKRWVHHQDLHITLAFLGAAQQDKLQQAEKNVTEILNSVKPFTLTINKLGIFGMKESPRVFWADTEENHELQDIRKKVFTACERAGFQLETRPFKAHITLARKWSGDEPFQMKWLEKWTELQPEPLAFTAKEVVLYQTHLTKTPKYEAISVYPLQT
ncbi:RNA 2',3'-cyclic phosphodiesterase [Neobacillus niacini]|uniref:RNA 2',3'-cyclic phosphodiesterase n=1 Tax=Neobacillus niacini TaxID=86668 RepID=UPI002559AE3A|nr:RNA 2',3'-cyclic phosphodiesterase [Neobacillus niacini]